MTIRKAIQFIKARLGKPDLETANQSLKQMLALSLQGIENARVDAEAALKEVDHEHDKVLEEMKTLKTTVLRGYNPSKQNPAVTEAVAQYYQLKKRAIQLSHDRQLLVETIGMAETGDIPPDMVI
jgi:iron only hydrogenase large subunit-like protein